MATRAAPTENNNSIQEPARQSTNSASMDLLGSPPSTTPAARQGNIQPSPGTEANRASSRSIAPPTAVRNPVRVNAPPSRLAPSAAADRKLAASAARSSPLADNTSTPVPATSTSSSSIVAQINSAPSSVSSSTTSTLCRTGADCPSNICVAGTCQVTSAFATSLSSATSLPASANSSHIRGSHKSKHGGTPTACSDPRCTLPADITSMNGAEEKDVSASLGSSQRAVSSAATAGIVLAVLFAILALLLVVPKIRDVFKKCFGYSKENDNDIDDIIYPNTGNNDDGSPEIWKCSC